MRTIADTMGALLTSVQVKWTKVYAPVLFITEKKEGLIPLMRDYKSRVMELLREDPLVLSSIEKTYSEIEEVLQEHIEKTSVSDVDLLSEANFDSALVFGHSILDDTLTQCLRLGYLVWPAFYLEKIAQRKVSWADLEKLGKDEALNQAVSAWLDSVERESVRQKFELLLALTKPRDASAIVKDFEFDLSKVEEIDRLRHNIVHSTKTRKVSMEDLEYFSKSTNFATSAMVMAGAPISKQGLINGLGVDQKVQDDVYYQAPAARK